MDNAKIREMLDGVWENTRLDKTADPVIDSFVGSGVNSIRYAIITQLLGKIANPARDILALQSGGGKGDLWDARSFAKKVVSPWINDNGKVLRDSTDPYVSKPLRRPRLDDSTSVRNMDEWDKLVGFLKELNNADLSKLRTILAKCLQSIRRMEDMQQVEYTIPERTSLDRVCDMVSAFIQDRSGGYRPQAVCAAFMRIVGKQFNLFDDIRVQGINQPDAQSGAHGDITCYREKAAKPVIKVKDRNLTVSDLTNGTSKIDGSGICNLLFVAPMSSNDRHNTRSYIEKMNVDGISVYRTDIVALIRNTFVLLGNESRIAFIKEVIKELDEDGKYADRRRWSEELIAS